MKKSNKPVQVYNFIGIVLCGCAGGIVGFLSGGVFLSALGIAAGVAIAYFLKKRVLPICF